MANEYTIVERTPTVDEYTHLCTAVGWGEAINFAVSGRAMANSLYAVVVEHHGEVVGMGRIVGDDAIFYYIQDLAVLPEHQKKGVGKQIVDALFTYIRENAAEQAFVGLFAAGDTVTFYEQYGLKDHSPSMTGIFRVTPL